MMTAFSTSYERAWPLEVIRRKGARRMKLMVDPRDGAVKLIIPPRAALGPAMDWVKTQDQWIARQIEKLPMPTPIAPGMIVPLAGKELELDWAPGHPRGPKQEGGRIIVGGPRELLETRLVRWLKRQALELLEAETRAIGAKAGVTIGKVGIGDPRTRWGSCTADGDIRYNWRLVLAPDYVRRATVAHEVAHRVHMDHSRAFHALVAKLHDGDPKLARHWLRNHGSTLHWFGRES
jgi:predicted metal-dependent hydrolase